MIVSACITSFNQQKFLVEAIESVLNQTLLPDEILILDDGSTDDSPAVIASYAGRYPNLIRPLLREQNQGVAATFNLGLDVAQGTHISFLAGDDRWLPRKLELEICRLQNADSPDGVFSDYYFTRWDGKKVYRWAGSQKPPQGNILTQVLARDFPRKTLFRCELADLRLWRHVGRYDTNFSLYEDWEAHIRLAGHLRYAYIAEPLSEYRRHQQGLSSVPVARHLAAVDQIEKKHAGLINSLKPNHRVYIQRGLRGWRAHLLRSEARKVALQRRPNFRSDAWEYYLQSLRYEMRPDLRLLWYLIKRRHPDANPGS